MWRKLNIQIKQRKNSTETTILKQQRQRGEIAETAEIARKSHMESTESAQEQYCTERNVETQARPNLSKRIRLILVS
jgi:hypothetical protein